MKRHAAMNRIYRLVWSRVSNAWVAVAENAKGRGKGSSRRKLITAALALIGSGLLVPLALAAPTGGQISAGAGSIAQTGANTTITQSSQNLAINWQGFSIAADEAVRFNQPNATAIALNRVLGQDPSQILGSLSANGQVFILNPNGVLFGTGSQVNVGGLVASTLSLSDADFMAGNHTFSNGGTAGAVVNQGTLTAAQGGYIALLAPEVRNEGVISATLGTALLAAGDKVTLSLNNGSLLSYSIDQGALNALADNKQLIQADGGQVFMSAQAANALTTAMVNNTGIIQARTVQNVAGVIKLMGDMQVGRVNVGGTLDASAPNGGNGGFIETSAAYVQVADTARVTTYAPYGITGTWLIDPIDFTIAAGSAAPTTSGIGAVTLSTSLGSTGVTIQTDASTGGNGDIFVNDAVLWSGNTILTLQAHRNIAVNANITATGSTAGLVLTPNFDGDGSGGSYSLNNGAVITLSGSNPSLSIAGNTYTVINEANGGVTALQNMSGNLVGRYALGSNIDAADTSTWNGGAGFTPIGDGSTQFSGTFDGLGNTISNLTIDRPTNYVGLFGYTSMGSEIRNVGLVGGSVRGFDFVGGLVGYIDSGLVSSSYATGNVSGNENVGGLAGFLNVDGTISNSYAKGDVAGYINVGGLVGTHTSLTTITNSYATGNVEGIYNVGGLVGYNLGTVINSYATGSVRGVGEESEAIGGLVGYNSGSISNSYATTGSVDGDGGGGSSLSVGGLVGYNDGTVYNSYAKGDVFGVNEVGGLVGTSYGAVTYSYATGEVIGDSSVGGLVGYSDNSGGVVDNSYAIGNVSGIDSVGGLVGDNSGGSIINSYATGSVIGDSKVGGLVGGGYGPIDKSYATGLVSGAIGAISVGGLVGFHDFSGGYGSVTNSFWDSTVNPIGIGSSTAGDTTGATGRTSAQMMSVATFSDAGWDIANTGGSGATWRVYEGQTTPWLTWWLKPVTVTLNSDIQTYSGAPYSGGNGYAVGNPAPSPSGTVGSPNPALSGALVYGGSSQSAVNAGNYTISASGLYSVQQGYDISYVNGALTINPVEILNVTPPVAGILPAVVEAIIALPGGADLLPAFSSTVVVAATQIDAVPPHPVLSNLQYVYVATTGTLSGLIDTTVDGKPIPIKVQGSKSDGFNERLADAPIQFTGTVLVRNGGINLPGDADDSNERDKKRGNK